MCVTYAIVGCIIITYNNVQINERGSYDMPTYLMTLSTRRQQIEEDFDRELQKRERSASPPIIRGASAIYSG